MSSIQVHSGWCSKRGLAFSTLRPVQFSFSEAWKEVTRVKTLSCPSFLCSLLPAFFSFPQSATGQQVKCQCHHQRAPSSLRQSDRQVDKRMQHHYDKATQTYWRPPNHAVSLKHQYINFFYYFFSGQSWASDLTLGYNDEYIHTAYCWPLFDKKNNLNLNKNCNKKS